MASAAEKARRHKASTIARAKEAKASRQGADGPRTVVAVGKPRERRGLEWLLHKKRITARQFWAGTEYGNLYRLVQASGLEPLRSCIGDGSGRGGSVDTDKGKIPGMSFAEHSIDAGRRLTECHALALRSETNMIATCAAICGRQLTPREITAEHVETVEIETTLRLALNLLADHLEGRQKAA